MKRLSVPFLMIVSVLSFSSARPVFAASLVQPIPIAQAQGGGAKLSVWLGSGTNIDFTRTGEVIQKVWLDDPSALAVDFDGSLGGSGSDNGGSQGTGASVIHLRRVTGISFPNLPETASTLLTAVTQSSDGGHHVYQFQVNYGSGTPQYATVALMPGQSSSSAGAGAGSSHLVVSNGRTATLSDVDRGLQQAISQNLIAASSPIVSRTQDFLARARNGTAMQSAADEANISMAVVSRLATMGMSRLGQSTLLPSNSTNPNSATPANANLSSAPAAPL